MRFETRRIKPTIPSSVPRPFPPFLASPQPSQTACLPHIPSPIPSAGPDVPPRPYISRPNPIPPPASTLSLSTSLPFPCPSFPPLLPYLPPPPTLPQPGTIWRSACVWMPSLWRGRCRWKRQEASAICGEGKAEPRMCGSAAPGGSSLNFFHTMNRGVILWLWSCMSSGYGCIVYIKKRLRGFITHVFHRIGICYNCKEMRQRKCQYV